MSGKSRIVRPETRQTEKKAVHMVQDFFNAQNWHTNQASEEDFGIDLFVTVAESRPPRNLTPIDFCAQIKGTRQVKGGGDHLLWAVDREHVLSWRERSLPVLFLLCDVAQGKIYWLWVNQYLTDVLPRINPKWRDLKEVTLRIPRANCVNTETSTDLRKQAGRMVWPIVHEKLIGPADLSKQERQKLFCYKLDDLPYPFLDQQDKKLNVLLVSGPTRYELEKLETRFEKTRSGFRDVKLGNEIVLGESAYNLSLASEVLSALCSLAGTKKLPIEREKGRLILPYVAVDDSMLERHNVIYISCGDVNPFLPLALKDFELKNLVRCPVHHEPYETSERIVSEVTRASYEKEREHEWAGYILLLPNPWNEAKAVLICGGNKGMGTQAALLRVLMAIRGERPLHNSKGLPAKVVVPEWDRSTMLVSGVRDLE